MEILRSKVKIATAETSTGRRYRGQRTRCKQSFSRKNTVNVPINLDNIDHTTSESTTSTNFTTSTHCVSTSPTSSTSFSRLFAQSIGNKGLQIRTAIEEQSINICLLTETWTVRACDYQLHQDIRVSTCLGRVWPASAQTAAALKLSLRMVWSVRLSRFHYCIQLSSRCVQQWPVQVIYRSDSAPVMETFFQEITCYMKVIDLYKYQIIVAVDFNI